MQYELTEVDFLELINIFTLLIDNETILIKDSMLCMLIHNTNVFIEIDVTNIFKTNINFHVINSKNNIKLLKSLVNKTKNNKIYIVEENYRYVVFNTKGKMKIFFPKYFNQNNTTPPLNSNQLEKLCRNPIKMTKLNRTEIKILTQNQEYVNILVDNNQLIGLAIPNVATYWFDEKYKHKNEDDCKQLKSYNFLKVSNENSSINFGIINNSYWLVTISLYGTVKVISYEEVLLKSQSII